MSIPAYTKEETFYLKTPLYLESGRILEEVQIRYSMYGKPNAQKDNVILVTHALSLDHKPLELRQGDKKGWWADLIGEGLAIDLNRYCVICANALGSIFGSTNPRSINPKTQKPYGLQFPVFGIKDIALTQKALLDHLGIDQLYAIVGGSMGGMIGLQMAVDFPDIAQKAILLATTPKIRDYAIAFNKIIMQSIVNDHTFNDGEYDDQAFVQDGLQGLSVARMLGHVTFLSPWSMAKKFKGEYVSDDGLFDLFGRYQIERYLDYNGVNFSKRFDPTCYLYLAKALNIFDVSRGYGDLSNAIGRIKAQLHLVSFKADGLFLSEEMQDLHEVALKCGVRSRYLCVDSDYGHDSFLVQVPLFEALVKDALG